ncbi:MAG TPA: radical SAM protein [Thermoplasmataceae archaeon]|nr:radical SAM protein [Thermoplasmatales archaeon AK]HLH86443.1 radical SAM protein [Thermoplasmataceae archaeon]
MLTGSSSPWAPSLVFVETTKACEYACRHCRAVSQRTPSPDELSTTAVENVLDQIRKLSPLPPGIIFTGGNLLLRQDIKHLISYASDLGLSFSISPAASSRLTEDFLEFARDAGVRSVSLSLDGSSDRTHEWLRMMPGSFDLTLNLLDRIKQMGLKAQVNTTVHAGNVSELPELLNVILRRGISTWEIFFLIKTGRAVTLDDVSPPDYMQIVRWLSWIRGYGVSVRAVEAPLLRVVDGISEERPELFDGGTFDLLRRRTLEIFQKEPATVSHGSVAQAGNNHFTGTLFISHNGSVYPSGLFDIKLGNVLEEPLRDIIFRNLDILDFRNSGKIWGKCGSCEFLSKCGGSRARAFAYTHDPFSSDPSCTYTQALKVREGD